MMSLCATGDNETVFKFCPLCQVPLQHLKISPASHVSSCSVAWDGLIECPDRENCLSISIFHYRDFSHSELAKYRSSEYYIEPVFDASDVKPRRSPLKKSPDKILSKTPLKRLQKSKSPQKICKKTVKKKPICTLSKEEIYSNNDDDEDGDDDVFKTKKSDFKRLLHRTNSEVLEEKKATPNKRRKQIKNGGNIKMIENETSIANENDELGILDDEFSVYFSADLNVDKESSKTTEDVMNDENHQSSKISVTSNDTYEDDSLKLCSESVINYETDVTLCGYLTVKKEQKNHNCDNRNIKLASIFIPKHTRRCKSDTESQDIDVLATDILDSNGDFSTKSKDGGFECFGGSSLNSVPRTTSDSLIETQNSYNYSDSPGTSNRLKREVKVSRFRGKNKNGSSEHLESKPMSSMRIMENLPFNKSDSKSVVRTWSNIRSSFTKKDTNRRGVSQKEENKLAKTQPNQNKTRECPFYKRIPDTPIVVDAFQYGLISGIKAYFLSHFHSDHYIGLKKAFNKPIYCSKITANLVMLKIGVDKKYIHILKMNERILVEGVEVVALEANHCPGSVMFLFQLRNGQNYLHVGDFRADPKMEKYPELKKLRVHKLFLDTTYCKPIYTFPTQQEVIQEVVKIVNQELSRDRRTLFVVGSYVIGKEKVFMAIAEECKLRVFADVNKYKVFRCLEDKRLIDMYLPVEGQASIHVLPMTNINIFNLNEYLKQYSNAFSRLVAFRPTGWCQNSSTKFKSVQFEKVIMYDVPYSEHSSFTELRRFVQFIRPDEIIPTVNVGEASRNEMAKYFKTWLSEANQTSILDFVNNKKDR